MDQKSYLKNLEKKISREFIKDILQDISENSDK